MKTASNGVTRRAGLAALLTAPLASCVGAVAPAVAEGADAHLLELCEKYCTLRDRQDEIYSAVVDAEEAWQKAHGSTRGYYAKEGPHELEMAKVYALSRELIELWKEIGGMRATTLQGVLAKIRLIESECHDGGIEEESCEFSDGITPQSMSLTLTRDLRSILERGGLNG